MAVNYKRRQTNIKNRNWTEHTEKQNADYMKKQLKDLGYKVPNYMKKGEINLKQIENYSNRILNKLNKIIDKEYKESLSKSERKQFNKLNKIIVDRGGAKNDKELINNAIKIANNLKEYSKYINKLDKKNTELQDINRWIESGFASAETLLNNVHPALIKSKINKLNSMLETIENLTTENYLEDYLDRIGAGNDFRKTFKKKYGKLNTGQKIFFNTAVWDEFKIEYNKEKYEEATTLEAKRKYLEDTLDKAVKTIL